jgi:hypothetical protein
MDSGMDTQRIVLDFLRDEIDRERTNGFDLLLRSPSTNAMKFLDYFHALNTTQQDALVDGLAQRALFQFFDLSPLPNPHDTNTAYRQFCDIMTQMSDWKYLGIRTLKGIVAEARESSHEYPPEIEQRARMLQSAKAPQIRKVVKRIFSESFGARATNDGDGMWRYEGRCRDANITVHINYGSRFGVQIRYGVWIHLPERALRIPPVPQKMVRPHPEQVNYGSLMGLATANWWDNIVEANLEESMAVLAEDIVHCVDLVKRLPSEYTQQSDS